MTKTNTEKKLDIKPGDIVRVHQQIVEGGKKRIQVFEGIVIKTHRRNSPSATFTVRKISSGVGVERTYPVNSPNVVKIEFKKSSKVRRAKLYYLRDLSGKALRLKEKKVDKDVWELVAQNEPVQEATEEDVAEAVEAAKENEKEENRGEEKSEESPKEENKEEPPQAEKDDKVEKEEKSEEKEEKGKGAES